MDSSSLLETFLASTGVCTDTRQLQSGNLFFALVGPNFDGNKFAKQALHLGASAAVVSDPALSNEASCVYVEDTLVALQALARAYRRSWTCPVVALTGSNGKTTTKELLASSLSHVYAVACTQGNLNNHIGVPLTLLAAPRNVDIVVVEMGANHQGEIAALCEIAEPTHGFITNIGRAHLEGFGGVEGVKRGKAELFDYLAKNGGCAFVDLADSTILSLATRVPKRLYYTTQASEADLSQQASSSQVVVSGQMVQEFPVVELQLSAGEQTMTTETHLPGIYNYRNLVQAAAVAHYFKVNLSALSTAFANYKPANQRSQEVRIGKASVLMDAYNANPDSMTAGLSWLQSRPERYKLAVLGEMKEMGAYAKTVHEELIGALVSHPAIEVLLFGEAYKDLDVSGLAKATKFVEAHELARALEPRLKQSETVILLKGSRSNRLEQVLAKAQVD